MKTIRTILLTVFLSGIFAHNASALSLKYPTFQREDVYFYWIHGLNDDYAFWKHMCSSLTPGNGSTITLSYDSIHEGGAFGIAEELNKKIRKDKKVVLIGHSAGGVIARQIADMNDNVIGVITVGTPNQGAGIVSSVESESYMGVLHRLEERVRTLESETLNALAISGYPITTFLAPIINVIYYFEFGRNVNEVINNVYNSLDLYVSPFTNQQLFWDLAPDSHFITEINSTETNTPQVCIGGEENEWQLFRIIGTAMNLNSIKTSGISDGYDTEVIEEYIYEALNVIAEVIHYHNAAYDALGWAGIIMPWLFATREVIKPSRNNWESLARYINIGVHTDWAEEIGACHYEQRTVRVPVYDPSTMQIDPTNPSIGGNGPGLNEFCDMPAGFIGYEDRIETVFVYDSHDGVVGANSAYSSNGRVARYSVQGVNHLEMGALDTPLKDIIDKAIDKVLEMKLQSAAITGEVVSNGNTIK